MRLAKEFWPDSISLIQIVDAQKYQVYEDEECIIENNLMQNNG